eukprot:CAMPEP_0117835056 /NCGR_PEP_ID=MMETSP0949-20121206/11273_1 /TAXON_ID=44440 /ORGANISM="Chattonella subsalsa, Strain CCMP2191" /LENGTH=67 /DNA_ID=CAMNT_0005677003 /DNA_START=974 /DNA_END=1177 /DNA_ORIENTATION=+
MYFSASEAELSSTFAMIITSDMHLPFGFKKAAGKAFNGASKMFMSFVISPCRSFEASGPLISITDLL